MEVFYRKLEQAEYDLGRYKGRNAELLSGTAVLKAELAKTRKSCTLLAQSLKSHSKERERDKERISDLEGEIDNLKGQVKRYTKQIKVLEQRAVAVKIVEFTSNVCPKCRKRENLPHTEKN